MKSQVKGMQFAESPHPLLSELPQMLGKEQGEDVGNLTLRRAGITHGTTLALASRETLYITTPDICVAESPAREHLGMAAGLRKLEVLTPFYQ